MHSGEKKYARRTMSPSSESLTVPTQDALNPKEKQVMALSLAELDAESGSVLAARNTMFAVIVGSFDHNNVNSTELEQVAVSKSVGSFGSINVADNSALVVTNQNSGLIFP
jgi:hypothetical protein